MNAQPPDQQSFERRLKALLDEYGVPGFIIFGWKKQDGSYRVTYSTRRTPKTVFMKCLAWVMNDYASKKL